MIREEKKYLGFVIFAEGKFKFVLVATESGAR